MDEIPLPPPSLAAEAPIPPNSFMSKPRSSSVSSTDSETKSPRTQYKKRRQRAREHKKNAGRNLRITSAVGPDGNPIEVCVDVALERVTQKRAPKVMTDEEVAALLSLSLPNSTSSDNASGAVANEVNVERYIPVVREQHAVLLAHTTKRAVTLISDSQVESLLRQSSGR